MKKNNSIIYLNHKINLPIMRRYFLILFRYKSRPYISPFLERWSINIHEDAFFLNAISTKVSIINSLYDESQYQIEILNVMEINSTIYSKLDQELESRYVVTTQDEIEG